MRSDDERQWTRLIDGELSFSEQRALLSTLDETPNGWKRLALALLEAEAFRRELRNCSPHEPPAVTIAAPPEPSAIHRRLRAAITGMAAIVGVCLGMGIEHQRRPAAAVINQTHPVAATFATDAAQTQQTLKLVFADGPTEAQSVEVAVIDAEGVEAAGLLQQSAVPVELRQQLESQGYVIHEERRYVPVSLTDGREGIAPISDVVVEYQPVAFQ